MINFKNQQGLINCSGLQCHHEAVEVTSYATRQSSYIRPISSLNNKDFILSGLNICSSQSPHINSKSK